MLARHSPAVAFPVLRTMGMACFIGLWVLLGCMLSLAWLRHGAGVGIVQIACALIAVVCMLGVAWCACHAWRNFPVGTLHWDGAVWSFVASAAPALPVNLGVHQVMMDVQWALLMRCSGDAASVPVRWMWLQKSWAPHLWCDLRRAVYSSSRTAHTLPGADV